MIFNFKPLPHNTDFSFSRPLTLLSVIWLSSPSWAILPYYEHHLSSQPAILVMRFVYQLLSEAARSVWHVVWLSGKTDGRPILIFSILWSSGSVIFSYWILLRMHQCRTNHGNLAVITRDLTWMLLIVIRDLSGLCGVGSFILWMLKLLSYNRWKDIGSMIRIWKWDHCKESCEIFCSKMSTFGAGYYFLFCYYYFFC